VSCEHLRLSAFPPIHSKFKPFGARTANGETVSQPKKLSNSDFYSPDTLYSGAFGYQSREFYFDAVTAVTNQNKHMTSTTYIVSVQSRTYFKTFMGSRCVRQELYKISEKETVTDKV